MKIDRIHFPVHSLGPGERVAVWMRGCSRRCPGCISPDLQPAVGPETDEEMLAQCLLTIAGDTVGPGLTISGGEPFEQPAALLRLLKAVRAGFEDILVYTGYTLEQLQAGVCGEDARRALQYIDVLIDGPYIEALNQKDCVLRGSANQTIHYLDPDRRTVYLDYMRQGRFLETFSHNDAVYVVGIMDRREIHEG